MNKRIRKKKGLGEFDRLMFPVRITFSQRLSAADNEKFFDEFFPRIEEFRLQASGSCGPSEWDLIVGKMIPCVRGRLPSGRIQHKVVNCDDRDRETVRSIVENLKPDAALTVGPLTRSTRI